MLERIEVYKNMIIGIFILVIAAILYFYIDGLNDEISSQRTRIEKMKSDAVISDLEISQLKESLNKQNKAIKTLKNSNELKLKELKKWQSQKPNVKYKTITKIREVQSDECKDIKAQLDAIKRSDINRL